MLSMHSRKGSVRPLLKKHQNRATNTKADHLIQKFGLGLAAADSLNLSLIFAFKQYLAEVLAGLGSTIMFPFAAGVSLIRASLALRQAKREGYKKRGVLQAAVEVLAALAVVTAVVGSFVAVTLFATVAPLIFTVVSAAKTFYQAVSAGYYGIKSYLASDPDKKEKYKKLALTFGVSVFTNALATVALGLVMIAGKVSFGILGIIAGALGTVYAAYQVVTTKTPTEKAADGVKVLTASSTSGMYKTLGLKRSYSMDKIHIREEQGQTVHLPLSGIELIKVNNRAASVDENTVVRPKLVRSFSF